MCHAFHRFKKGKYTQFTKPCLCQHRRLPKYIKLFNEGRVNSQFQLRARRQLHKVPCNCIRPTTSLSTWPTGFPGDRRQTVQEEVLLGEVIPGGRDIKFQELGMRSNMLVARSIHCLLYLCHPPSSFCDRPPKCPTATHFLLWLRSFPFMTTQTTYFSHPTFPSLATQILSSTGINHHT